MKKKTRDGAVTSVRVGAIVDTAGGNISEAAKRLGISRNTIYRKLRWNEPRG